MLECCSLCSPWHFVLSLKSYKDEKSLKLWGNFRIISESNRKAFLSCSFRTAFGWFWVVKTHPFMLLSFPTASFGKGFKAMAKLIHTTPMPLGPRCSNKTWNTCSRKVDFFAPKWASERLWKPKKGYRKVPKGKSFGFRTKARPFVRNFKCDLKSYWIHPKGRSFRTKAERPTVRYLSVTFRIN